MKPTMYSNRAAKLFTRWMMALLTVALFSAQVVNAQSVSLTATAGTTGPTTYATVSAAFAAINAGTHQGDITMRIIGNTTEPATPTALLQSAAPSSYTSVLITPFGGNYTIGGAATPTANRAIIELNGADNVTIDGDDPTISGVRNLTIAFPSTSATIASCIRVSSSSTTGANGASNNTIKNCIITGNRVSNGTTATYGINTSNYSTTSSSTGGYSSLNNRFENNLITRCYHGIWAVGASTTYPNTGLRIINNVLGDGTAAGNIGLRGIIVSYTATTEAQSAIISGNEVVGVGDPGTTGYAASVSGMEIGTVNFGVKIFNNYIHDVKQPNTGGYGAYGVLFSGATSCDSVRFYNNIITRITASNYIGTALSTFTNYGVKMTGGTTFGDFSNNTIVLSTANPTGTFVNPISYAMSCDVNGVRIVNFRNNIIVNSISSTNAVGLHVNNSAMFTAANYAGGQIWDRNVYWVPSGILGFSANATPQSTFSAWKTATGKDGTSYNLNPSFVSSTDLHIDGSVASLLESGGMTTNFNTDFDGQARPGPAGSVNGGAIGFDIGADEFDGVPIFPVSISSASATASSCTAIAHTVTATVVPGTNPVISVTLTYTVNGTAQTPVTMTNTSGNIWEATIPAATPTNATIAWTVTAADAVASPTSSGSYQDDALLGIGAIAAANPASVCAGSNTSLSISFYNPNAAPTNYTIQAVTNPTTDEDIGNVTITDAATSTVLLNNTTTINSLSGTLGTATGTAGSYASYLSFGSINLTAGSTYNFSVSSLQGATPYGNSMAIYIDYNRDGDFADAGENAYVAGATTSGAHTETGSFVVPATANNGLTRMRVICNEGLVTSPTMAISYGEREEYLVNLITANNGGGGNIPSFTYSWSDGTNAIGTTSPLSTTVTANTTYSVIASTTAGCTIASSVAVTSLALPAAPTATNSAQCSPGVPTASVSSNTGLATPQFRWYAAATGGSALQSSTSTTYTTSVSTTTTFYVAEFDGTCESARTAVTVTVNTPPSLTPATVTGTNPACNGGSDGSVSFSATGGTAPYTYTFNGNAATSPVSGLAAGTYAVVATDANGCTASSSVTLTNPTAVSATISGTTNVACNGGSTGAAAVTAAGGTGTLGYLWSSGETVASITGKTAGSYVVTVTDANGCSASATATITEPTALVATATPLSATVCGATTTTSVTVVASGGTAPYTGEGSFTQGAGTTSYTVTDANGCTASGSATVTALVYTITATAGTNGSISPAGVTNIDCGGTQTYTITPDAGYQIDVLTVDGTPVTASLTYNFINVTANRTIDVTFTQSTCSTVATATAPALVTICSAIPYTLTGSIGGAATSGTWSTSGTGTFDNTAYGTGTIYTASAADIAAGTVTITLTTDDPDGIGSCVAATASTLITINVSPVVSISGTTSICAGTSTTLTASGAPAYLWSGTETTAAITVNTSGSYTVTGTAANGCTASATAAVVVNALPAAPVVSVSGATTFCSGGSVTLTSDYVGGNTWSNGATTDAISATASGSYSVTYTDANGCSATSAATAVTANASSANISGFLGICTGGSTTLTASATPAAVSYLWSDGSTTSAITVSVSGTYSVSTTDANGCTAVASATIVDAAPFTASITGSCATWQVGNQSVLAASASVVGAFTYAWNGGATTQTINATTAGTYTVTVTDAYGCSAIANYTLAGAPLNGTYAINSAAGNTCGTFSSLARVITHLNTFGVSGNVVIDVPAGYTETAPTGGFVLKMCGLASNLQSGPAQSITFQKSGAGANPVLTAAVGTSTTLDGIFVVVGADNVTIDGINLVESAANTTNTTRMEWGYAVLKCSGDNGSNDVVIRNTNVALTNAYTANFGIYVANHDNLSTTGFTNTTYTTTAQATRNKVSITGNTINNCYNGVRIGANPNTVATTGESLNDTLHVISNNTITNFGGGATGANGIFYANSRQVTIRGNTISSSATATSAASYGIYASSGVWATISGNTIQNIVSSSTFYGIYHTLSGGDATNPNIVNVDSNIVQNCTPTAGTFAGIYGSSTGGTNAQVSVRDNRFINHTWSTTSTATMYGFYNFCSGTNMVFNYTGNLVANNTLQNTNTFWGLYGGASNGTLNMNNNTVRNNVLSPSSGTTYLLYNATSGVSNVNNNVLTNNRRVVLSTATSVGITYGIYGIGGSSVGAGSFNNNIVDTLYNRSVPGTLTSIIYGIYVASTQVAGSTVNNNIVRNITTQGVSTGNQTIYGMSYLPSGPSNTIKGNRISRIGTTTSTTGISTDAQFGGAMNGFVLGLQLGGSTTVTPKFCDGNSINTIVAGGSNGIARGIWATTGLDWHIYNNAISRISAPFANPTTAPTASGSTTVTSGMAGVYGIDIPATTTTLNYFVYNNTIYLTGNGGGANFASSGIHANVGPNVTLVNNLVINLTTSGTSQAAVAYRRSAAGLTSYNNASDNNLFYTGTPGTTKLIYGEGVGATTNSKQTLADFKTFVGPTRDANSRTEASTPFVAASTDSLLHIAATTATFVESGGKPYPAAALTTDIDGQTRNALAPDIGADEGNFVSILPQIIAFSATPATGQCVVTSRTIDATTSASVTGVTLNYSFNGTVQTPIAMTGGSGVWTATLPAASPANAIVTWSLQATDGTYTVGATGTPYQDEYLSTSTLTAQVAPVTICLGQPIALSAYLGSTAPAPAAYAATDPSNTADEDIFSVTVGTLTQSSACGTLAPGAGSIAYRYSNYTSNPAPLLIAGTSINYSIQVGTCGTTPYQNRCAIFIDLNRDGDFSDAGERVVQTAVVSGAHVASGSFTLPSTVSYGFTRMRVINNETTADITPAAYSYGETEDYTVQLAGGAGFTYTWSDGTNSITPVSGSYTPTTAGSYSYQVTGTDPNGCTIVSAPVTVTVNPLPVDPTTTASSQCGTAIPGVRATGGTAYNWYLNTSGGTPIQSSLADSLTTYTISTTTTFYVSSIDLLTGCESGRIPVLATVVQPDPIDATVDNDTVCPGTTIALSVNQVGSSNTYAYSWAGANLNATSGTSVTANPTGASSVSYVVTAVDAALQCVVTDTVVVALVAPPVITSVTASPAIICANSPSTITALTNENVPGTRVFGAGTTTSTLYGPYYGFYGGARRQYLVKASELVAQGFAPGNLTSVSFDYTSFTGPYTFNGFSIGIANTSLTALTSTYQSGMTTVFPSTNLTITAASGTITHNFATPFFWDGTSNIILEFCWNNADGGGTSTNTLSIAYTTMVGAHTIYSNIDNSGTVCSTPTGTTSTLRPNIRLGGVVAGFGAGSYSWSWSDGSSTIGTGNVLTVNPSTSTTYTATATDPATGCTSSQSVGVTVNPLPTAPTATNSTQCGAGIPSASVASTSGMSNPGFNWYSAATGGTLLQGPAPATGPLQAFYTNDFSGALSGASISGAASLTGGAVQLTPNLANNQGGLTIPASGVNADKYRVSFNLSTSALVNIGADGLSYSFADDASATATTPNAETGTGTKLKVSFDSYGTAGGGIAGIRVIYGSTISNPSINVGTDNVLAYSSVTSWAGAGSVPVIIDINNAGQLSLTVSGTPIFTNVQLPASYLTDNKSNWVHVFSARTGGVSQIHSVDDVTLEQSGPVGGYTTYQSSISTTTTFYVAEINQTTGCEGPRTPVTVDVTQPDGIQASVSAGPYCLGGTLSLSVADTASSPQNTYTYSWSANSVNAGLSGTSGASVTATPTVAGTYVYTATGVDGQCTVLSTVTVVMSANPSVDSISATPSAACAGAPVQLFAAGLTSGVQTLPTGYCAGGGSATTADEQIFGFQLGALNNLNQAENCLQNNTDYTSTIPALTLIVGNSYPFTIQTNECDGPTYFSNGASIFIDYNRDGDWDDTGERVYTTTATIASPNTRTGTITIPVTATPGLTRMRVKVQESVASPLPCATFSYGEIEDYTVNIIGLSAGSNTFVWTPGGATGNQVTVNPTTTTTYTVTATSPEGCTATNSVAVNVTPLPAAVTAVDSVRCGFGPATVSVVSNSGVAIPGFNWYNDAVGGTPFQSSNSTSYTGNVSVTDTFYVSEVDLISGLGCESPRTMVIQNVTQPDDVTASISDTAICLPGASVTLNATQTGTTNNYTYTWTAVPPVGSGLSGVVLGPITTLFSSDFTSSTVPSNVTLNGAANIGNGVLQVTPNALSSNGAVQITGGGNAADTISVTFDLIVPQNGADGVSYSYTGNGVLGVDATMNAENGTGSHLKIAFVSYTNGAATNGIYVMYNSTGNEQTPTSSGVLAYSSDVSWRGSATPTTVAYTIGSSGLLNLSLNGTPVFTDVQLPASYLSANKSNWSHYFKARTGGVSEEHSIDNMVVDVAQFQTLPTPGQTLTVTPTLPGTYTYYVLANDGDCNEISSVTLTANSPAAAILAGADQEICEGSSVTVNAAGAGLIPALRFTEVLWQVNAGTGNTGAGIPSWASTWYTANGGTTMDMIEITNLGAGPADYAGVQIELWNAASTTSGTPAYTYTFPSGGSFLPSAGRLYFSHSGSTVVNDFSNNFFTKGPTSIDNGSGTLAGMVIRKNGVLIDAVAVSGYSFPAASGVTSADWSGALAGNGGLSGSVLIAADNNTASSWVNTSVTTTASVGSLNAGLVANLPSLGTVQWTSIPAGFTGTNSSSTFGPITAPTQFVVMFDNGSCQSYDTVLVTPVSTPSAPAITSVLDTICVSGSTVLNVTNANNTFTYQWQRYDVATSSWVNIVDSTRTTLITPVFAPAADSVVYYRNQASCGVNSNVSNVDTLLIVVPKLIKTTPDTVCGTGTVSLLVDANGTPSWYATSSSAPVIFTGNQLDTVINNNQVFWVRIAIGSCLDPAGRQPVFGYANPAPPINITATPAQICVGQSTVLSATSSDSSGYVYIWNTGSTDSVLTVSPTATTTYVISGVNPATTCGSSSSIQVIVNDLPVITSITSTPPTACPGQPFQLNADAISTGPQTPPSGYCAGGGGTTTADEQIFGVSFGPMNNLSQGETCGQNNTDYTSSIPAITVNAGSTYPFSVVTDECDGATYFSSGLAIFIDYNRDGDWDDAGETAYTTTATTVSPNTRTGNITIPLTASVGVTRMRVKVVENVASPTACGTFTYGEAEDYLVNIQGPFGSFSWTPSATLDNATIATPTSSGITASTTFSVTVTSSAGCTSTGSVTVGVANVPAPVITTPDTNLCNSEIYVQVADNGPYAGIGYPAGTVFTWKDASGGTYFSAADADSISSLFGNSFFVTVNVPGGCNGTSDTAYVVTKAVTVVENITNASCAGGDGRIIANISSGIAPFNYVWSTDAAGLNVVRNVTTSATADTLNNLNAGTYYLVVTDEVGAPASCGSGLLTFTVSGSSAITATVNATDITCNGAGDGTATVTFTGGTAPIGILWNDGSTDVSRVITAGGTFTVIVSDNFGCSDTATATIVEPAALAATLSSTQATAAGATDGTASASVSGGTAPISIEWFDENLDPAGSGATATGLSAGLYYVLITDANNCQLIETITVTEITDINFNITAIFEGFHDGLGGMVPALLNTGIGTSLTEVDTIRVELRDAISPTTVVASANAVINTAGLAQLTFPGAVTGNSYYVAVFHRNAVQTWSALPVTMTNNGSYNFTSSSSQAYFDNMIEVTTGVWAFFSGDVDPQDEVVDILDQGSIDNDSFNFVGGYVATDVNGDGVVDILDQGIVDNNAFNFIGSAHP